MVDDISLSSHDVDLWKSPLEASVSMEEDTTTGSSGNLNITPSAPLAQKETKFLRRSKVIILFVLVVAAAFTAFGVYRVTTRDEEEDFKTRVSVDYFKSKRLFTNMSIAYIFHFPIFNLIYSSKILQIKSCRSRR
jgi:hypothetical protein